MGNVNQNQVYSSLMAAGCLPFIVAAASPYFSIYELPLIGHIETAIALFALALVSFMAGTLWGISLEPQRDPRTPNTKPINSNLMMVASNTIVVLPWLIYCILGSGISYYFSLAVTFVLIVMTDYHLASRQVITHDYCRSRLVATIVIVICLVSLAFTA